jgi:hypothetical protein
VGPLYGSYRGFRLKDREPIKEWNDYEDHDADDDHVPERVPAGRALVLNAAIVRVAGLPGSIGFSCRARAAGRRAWNITALSAGSDD